MGSQLGLDNNNNNLFTQQILVVVAPHQDGSASVVWSTEDTYTMALCSAYIMKQQSAGAGKLTYTMN
eukprot:scaffold320017_cov116-Cyclotella_meneghiniana.AAC.2